MNGVNNNNQITGETDTDGAVQSLKRPLEVTLDGEIVPAKKASEDGVLIMTDADKFVDTYQVPEKVVGWVIGKGGSEIRNIQQTSGCRVQMDPDNQTTNGYRNCTIEGTRKQVEIARQLISQVIARNQVAQMPGPGGEVTEEIFVPAEKCGLVIGKGGETIRTIQEQSGLRSCAIVQDSTAPTGQPKPLRMVGTPTAVETAKALVNNIVNNITNTSTLVSNAQRSAGGPVGHHQQSHHHGHYGGGGGGNDAQAKGEVIVPRLSAGMIIGKGGEMIKRLAMETGTKIQFKPDENPGSEDRVALIIGTREQIYRATERITEIVNRAIKNAGGVAPANTSIPVLPGQNVFFLHVPAAKCGLVIGKGGENIKQIERETGAFCALAQPKDQKNEDEKVFEIRGTPQQIHHASHLVKIKVGEVAPNTPVPPMQGHGGYANFGGGAGGFSAQFLNQQAPPQQLQQQQQPQAQQYGQQWNPSGGVAPQVATIPQGAPQQQQDPIAPTVNPTTGAPDYSAQWAAYYRSIGLADQAAMVEHQMRRNQAAAAASVGPTGQPQPQQQYYHHAQ